MLRKATKATGGQGVSRPDERWALEQQVTGSHRDVSCCIQEMRGHATGSFLANKSEFVLAGRFAFIPNETPSASTVRASETYISW
jgi:hypothetical protein